jgi:phosphosulfolactate phosphohydrolase-like enzyme
VVLIGSPRNEVAVTRQAAREAVARECNVLILCAGDQAGYGVSLEDVFVAGMLVERFVRMSPRRVTPREAAEHPDALALDDSAIMAHRLFRSYLVPGDGHATSETLFSMFAESRSGRDLPGNGFGADLAYCAEIDVTTAVPRLGVRGDLLTVAAQGSGDSVNSD